MASKLVKATSTTYESIYILLNEEDPNEQDNLTKQWREHKLAELNFIGIVGALVAGCLTSTGSWPNIMPDDAKTPWPVRACFFSGIIFSFAAVLSAAFQTIRLHRLSCHRDSLAQIRHIMSSPSPDREGKMRPRALQVWAWQASVVFLTFSVLALMLGLFILVWASTGLDSKGWWDGYAKVAMTLTVVGFATVSVFGAFQISLYASFSKGRIRLV